MPRLIVLGDTHGDYRKYLQNLDKIEKDHPKLEMTIQLGDHGITHGVRPPEVKGPHYFFCGNHDNYESVKSHPSCLGRFGPLSKINAYFVSGGHTPNAKTDKRFIPDYNWFECEELTKEEQDSCRKQYEWVKPEIVITHGPPTIAELAMFRPKPPHTELYKCPHATFLQTLYEIHQPRTWIFGHWHMNKKHYEPKTEFVCIGMDQYEIFNYE